MKARLFVSFFALALFACNLFAKSSIDEVISALNFEAQNIDEITNKLLVKANVKMSNDEFDELEKKLKLTTSKIKAEIPIVITEIKQCKAIGFGKEKEKEFCLENRLVALSKNNNITATTQLIGFYEKRKNYQEILKWQKHSKDIEDKLLEKE